MWGFLKKLEIQLPSVQFSRSVMSNSLRPHESQHAKPPCPSPTPRVHSDLENCHITQQSHCWAYTPRKPDLKETCLPQLFIIARTWKQPRCPSADEWIRKLWYIYTMEYYSVVKKNSFESVLMRWMKLEPIIQSEVSQKEKHQYSILTHIYGI